MKLISIIISYNPNYSSISNLAEQLTKSCEEVIIIDNNSEQELSKSLLQLSKCIVLRLSDNFGIAFAQNMGIKKAIELGASHILFFDQDSKISNNFVDDLISDYKKISVENTKIAAIGPRFIDENKGFYFPALRFNKHGLIDKISVENISSPVEVSFLISSGTLVSVEALNDIGLMREEFFIDFVDTEWCFRALSKGYKIYMSERAVMKHSIGDDTLKIYKFNIPVHSGFRRYYRIRNLFFMWKMPYIPKVLIVKLMITNFIIQILLFLIKDKKKDYLKFYIKAVKDGLKQIKNYQA